MTTAVRSLLVLLVMVGVGCSASRHGEPDDLGVPGLSRELRAVWIATVANIDWPSQPGLPVAQQKAELLALLDRAAALNLNAVVLQVRPAGDAFYRSELEPWSEWLTGAIGRPPTDAQGQSVTDYDPLAFAVAEAHARGLELHAWCNPYRVYHPSNKTDPSADHLAVTRPDLVRAYGGYLWLDPGEPDVQAHTLAVVRDIVSRYDIDAIHFDDYFYPYPIRDEAGKAVPFPDDASYARYREAGGKLARDDWRRRNVNGLIKRLRDEVHAIKPHVALGISPFGIWRPGHPAHVRGFDQYAAIYADARRWWREGWVDYLSPQLYWQIARPEQSFIALLRWWDEENVRGRHLWPGLYTSRLLSDAPAQRRGFDAEEIAHQIQWTRLLTQRSAPGHIHFSAKALLGEDNGLAERLAATLYAEPALVPASPWLDGRRPARPKIARHGWYLGDDGARRHVELRLAPGSAAGLRGWVVAWSGSGSDAETGREAGGFRFIPAAGDTLAFDLPAAATVLKIIALDRRSVASRPTMWKLP